MILIIDNYDSFTYNIYQYVSELNADTKVFRNDLISIQQIEKINPTHIIISPGPGLPNDAGISVPVIESFAGHYPILGVCLGHQAIAVAFGGKLVRAPEIVHGKPDKIFIEKSKLFDSLPNEFMAARYHSLIVSPDGFPAQLKITARTDDGLIMALEHREIDLFGVQFHPESIATDFGKTIIKNFLNS
jgi:anthranilate synthase component 2